MKLASIQVSKEYVKCMIKKLIKTEKTEINNYIIIIQILAVLEKARKGEIADNDEKLACFATCILKKVGIVSEIRILF